MAKSSHDATQTKREFSLSLMQPERIYLCAETVKEFVKLTIPAQDASSTFLHAIRKLQSNEILQTNLSGEPELLWYEGSQSEFTPAVKNLIGNVDIPDNAVYSEELRSLYEEKYRNALTRFKSDFSRTYNSFRSVIDFVIFARRPGYSGGTVSSRIGLIWLAPSDTWTDDEWLENILQEFICSCETRNH